MESVTGIRGGGAAHLECTLCGATYPPDEPRTLSPCCQKPLYARYDLHAIGSRLSREEIRCRSADLCWEAGEAREAQRADRPYAFRAGRRVRGVRGHGLTIVLDSFACASRSFGLGSRGLRRALRTRARERSATTGEDPSARV